MSQALSYLYDIYSGFINMAFNDFELFPNVTIGWIIIVILVFGIMINSILNIPKGVHFNGKSNSNRN